MCARLDLVSELCALSLAGHVVFHGPREQVLPFFARLGFQLPGRKGIADFLQEVTSKKDQRVSLPSPALPPCSSALDAGIKSVHT